MTNINQPQVGVGIIFQRDGKILAGRRKGAHAEGYYGWPGGHMEFGESLTECVQREALEETGLQVKEFSILCVYNMVAYGKHYLDIEVIVLDFNGEPEVREPDRIEGWEWYSIDDLPSPLFEPCQEAIRAIRCQNSNLWFVDRDGDDHLTGAWNLNL